jgi:hypothetical protein
MVLRGANHRAGADPDGGEHGSGHGLPGDAGRWNGCGLPGDAGRWNGCGHGLPGEAGRWSGCGLSGDREVPKRLRAGVAAVP